MFCLVGLALCVGFLFVCFLFHCVQKQFLHLCYTRSNYMTWLFSVHAHQFLDSQGQVSKRSEAGTECITCSVSLISLHAHDCRKLHLMRFLLIFYFHNEHPCPFSMLLEHLYQCITHSICFIFQKSFLSPKHCLCAETTSLDHFQITYGNICIWVHQSEEISLYKCKPKNQGYRRLNSAPCQLSPSPVLKALISSSPSRDGEVVSWYFATFASK